MMKHLNETVPSPHDVDHAVSLHFGHILEKMMAKDPSERYQTPADMLTDITLVKEGQNPVSTRPAPGRSSCSWPIGDEKKARPIITPQLERLADLPGTIESSNLLKPSRRGQSHAAATIPGRTRSSASAPAQPRTLQVKYAFLVGLAVAVTVLVIVVIAVLKMR